MADTHPGYTGARRATESGRSGTAGGTDDTTQPGQYPPRNDHGIFGGPLPAGTGAPGSSGGAGASADPTAEAGQLTGSDLGNVSAAETNRTGAPGSSGANPGTGGGTSVSYTDPGSYLGGTYESDTVSGDIDGPGNWTEANVSGYGTSGPQLPGIKGNQPTSTGAGQGRVLRGGRAVRG
jgi:hypothetical protein